MYYVLLFLVGVWLQTLGYGITTVEYWIVSLIIVLSYTKGVMDGYEINTRTER